MWCSSCQADVVGQVSSDNRRIHCSACQAILSEVHASSTAPQRPTSSDSVRSARELLSKWSAEVPGTIRRIDEPANIAPTQIPARDAAPIKVAAGRSVHGMPSLIADDEPALVFTGEADALPQTSTPELAPFEPMSALNNNDNTGNDDDYDEVPIPVDEETAIPVAETESAVGEADLSGEMFPYAIAEIVVDEEFLSVGCSSEEISLDSLAVLTRTHEAKSSQPAPPLPMRNWTILGGQICAFLGVVLMSIGTAQVVTGLFLSPPSLLPGAWLMTTLGQMLLLLGVVTLISGGLEETSAEIAHTIDRLVNKIDALEASQRQQKLDDKNRTAA